MVDKRNYRLVNRDESADIIIKVEARKKVSIPRHPRMDTIPIEILLQAAREDRTTIPVLAAKGWWI